MRQQGPKHSRSRIVIVRKEKVESKEVKHIKAIAVNGSPRKKWNTATLLEKAVEGTVSEAGFHHTQILNRKERLY